MVMPYRPSSFEAKVRVGTREYPLPLGFAIGEEYRTDRHKQRLMDFFHLFGKVDMLPEPLTEVYVFGVAIPDERNLELLIAAYKRPENADIRDSIVSMTAGIQIPVAASIHYPR